MTIIFDENYNSSEIKHLELDLGVHPQYRFSCMSNVSSFLAQTLSCIRYYSLAIQQLADNYSSSCNYYSNNDFSSCTLIGSENSSEHSNQQTA